MAKSGKTGLDRIQDGDAAESGLSRLLGDQVAEQAMPGVFSGGKQIIRTQAVTGTHPVEKAICFHFNDGTAMAVLGDFEVRYLTHKFEGDASYDDIIDGRVVEEIEG